MRSLVSKIEEYKNKDVFEFTNKRCRFVYKSSTVAAKNPLAGKSQAGKYCTGFRDVEYSDVTPRYGAKQQSAIKQFASLKKCVDDYKNKITTVKNEFR